MSPSSPVFNAVESVRLPFISKYTLAPVFKMSMLASQFFFHFFPKQGKTPAGSYFGIDIVMPPHPIGYYHSDRASQI